MELAENKAVRPQTTIGQTEYSYYEPGGEWGTGFTFDVPLAIILTFAWRELYSQRMLWHELSKDIRKTLTLLEQVVRQKE